MLRKLMKYEFMATGRIFLPLFAALLIIAAVNRVLSGLGGAPYGISIGVAVMLIVAVFVTVIILTIQRFRQNLLSNEGHLMMTLPVKTDSLVLSKLFTASIWSVLSFIIALSSVLIMASAGINFPDVARFFRELGEQLSEIPAGYVFLCILEALIFIGLCIFASILTLYTCLSLSMLVNRRRGLFSFGAFIAISTLLQIVAAILVGILNALEVEFKLLTNILSGMNNFWQAQVVIAAIIIFITGMCVAFYFTTRNMLKNRLNLQ